MSISQASRSHGTAAADLTMADILARVRSDEARTPRQRADISSAIRTLGKVLQRPLGEIPAEPARLMRTLDNFSPAMAGVSVTRWRNIVSLLRSALGETGVKRMAARSNVPLTAKWAALFEQIPDKRARFGLSRFARFCGDIGVDPNDVNDDILSRYLDALEKGNLITQPRKTQRTAAVIWNHMAFATAVWPQQRLTVPSNSQNFSLPWSTFRPSLKADFDAYLAHLASPDLLSDNYFSPLRPATLASRSRQLRAFISALVLRGRDAQDICSLAELVGPDTVRDGLRYFLDRADGKQTANLYSLACALRAVAKYWVKVEAPQLVKLDAICNRLRPKQQGMTLTNRMRLRQFEDVENIRKILLLPEMLMAPLAKIKEPTFAHALVAQTALCIEFLLMHPLRLKNLGGLDLQRHLSRTRDGGMHLDIPGEEVKNGHPIAARLPPHLVQMIDLYVARFRPLLMNAPSSFLFPGAKPGPKSSNRLRGQMVDCVKQRCGIEMNPHLYRHFAAKVYLDQNPGGYGVIRLTHGHTSVNTTTTFYCGEEGAAAFEQYDRQLLKIRDSFRGTAPVPGARKRRAA